MDANRHKTQKNNISKPVPITEEEFKATLTQNAEQAYIRPWHRIERGLRLNRLRIYVEDVAPAYSMTKEDKENFFNFLQKSLDKKMLNTLKVVEYNQATQRIMTIKGLEVGRQSNGIMRWLFTTKKTRGTDLNTRKKKKEGEGPEKKEEKGPEII